jgi:hypothetical protein
MEMDIVVYPSADDESAVVTAVMVLAVAVAVVE